MHGSQLSVIKPTLTQGMNNLWIDNLTSSFMLQGNCCNFATVVCGSSLQVWGQTNQHSYADMLVITFCLGLQTKQLKLVVTF